MKQTIAILILVFSTLNVFAQEKRLKEQALEKFKNEHYSEAIDLLEKALVESPNDAEIYYYLGWFNHYSAYDSRPLSGYGNSHSEQIFKYLDKALELNPNYGDAKYFYGAQCSGNAFLAMQNYDADKIRYFYQCAYNKGAYPEWLKEFGKNFLMSCDTNAILFTGGNADFDICSYLQLCENFRTDITLIPLGYIDRPWYVQFLKNGLKGVIKKVEINLTDQQIMDIHPFKWDTTTISIKTSMTDKKQHGLAENYQLKWQVNPDLFSERMHSKIESEKAKKRSYLSPQRAVLLEIVEDNFSKRPVFFSNFCSPTFYGGLNLYLQNCGIVSRLTPIETKETNFAFDYNIMEKILDEHNITNFKTLPNNNIPRISGTIVSGYYVTLLNLLENKDKKARIQLKEKFEKHLKIGLNKEFENTILNELGK